VHIPDFLAPACALALHAHLDSAEWSLVLNSGEKVFDLGREARTALTPDKLQNLMLGLHQQAQAGFQFLFESIRVPEDATQRRADPTLLNRFADFMNTPETLTLLRTITNVPAIAFADAQATAYGPGHFLTTHDDNVAGKNRFAAYVMNLTPAWTPDWGGLLQFLDGDRHVAQAWTPRFNALNLFAVPQPHAVTLVAPFAPTRRIAVTGWLRGL